MGRHSLGLAAPSFCGWLWKAHAPLHHFGGNTVCLRACEITTKECRRIYRLTSRTPSSSSPRANTLFQRQHKGARQLLTQSLLRPGLSKPRFPSSAALPLGILHTHSSRLPLLGREAPEASPQLTVCASGKRPHSSHPRKQVGAASLHS